MREKDEEIRFLKMQLAEEQRTISLLGRSLPSKKTLERELVTLQIEVGPSALSQQLFYFSVLTLLVRWQEGVSGL